MHAPADLLPFFCIFQVLNIPTKINKGTVEIIAPVELIHKGEKVGSSEAALLAKLGIRPFSYGLIVQSVYDNGSTFAPDVLDLTEDDLSEKFAAGISTIAALSLGISYPTLAAAPHFFVNAYKNVLAIAVETEYSFPLAEKTKEYLKVSHYASVCPWKMLFFICWLVVEMACSLYHLVQTISIPFLLIIHVCCQDPSKFVVEAAPAAETESASAVVEAVEKEEEKEKEEESDDDMGFGLFD